MGLVVWKNKGRWTDDYLLGEIGLGTVGWKNKANRTDGYRVRKLGYSNRSLLAEET